MRERERESMMRHTMCKRYGINAFSNPFAMLLVSLDDSLG